LILWRFPIREPFHVCLPLTCTRARALLALHRMALAHTARSTSPSPHFVPSNGISQPNADAAAPPGTRWTRSHTTNARPDRTSTPSYISLAKQTRLLLPGALCSLWRVHMSTNRNAPASELVRIKGRRGGKRRERWREEERKTSLQWSRQTAPPQSPDRGQRPLPESLIPNGNLINLLPAAAAPLGAAPDSEYLRPNPHNHPFSIWV
ncbi:hypothetical protein CI238_01239, partial [Colletotrichum incanum]